MQRGLTDARIDALQAKHGFVLPHDLRALYRWRNGSPRDSRVDVFAGHQFLALDEALRGATSCAGSSRPLLGLNVGLTRHTQGIATSGSA